MDGIIIALAFEIKTRQDIFSKAFAAKRTKGHFLGVRMLTEDASHLVREAKRSGTKGLPPYSEDLVRNTVREIKFVYEEAQSTYQDLDRTDESSMTKAFMLQLVLKRNQRCLLAFHNSRLSVIRSLIVENGQIPAPLQGNLSKLELDFTKAYLSNLSNYHKCYPFLSFASAAPPKDLFIEVRVLKDCGSIMTESGTELHLSENSCHFVKRTDVEHLIRQGLLVHIN